MNQQRKWHQLQCIVRRYAARQKFGKHVDESVALNRASCTGYTLLVYLNYPGMCVAGTLQPGLVGGETVFYGRRGKKVAAVEPRAGMALLHIHGDECLEHEGAEVVRGFKYVLRSDVVFE